MLVSQILKSKIEEAVVTIRPDATVSEAAAVLSARRIGSLVVSADGVQPAGIFSERDIVRELGVRGPGCMKDRVGDIMTPNPVTCTPDTTADQVLRRMTDGRFRHMPVCDGGKMVGLISIGDVVKARMDELSEENKALEGMIMGF